MTAWSGAECDLLPLFVAGSQDLIAQRTGVSIATTRLGLRILLLVAPEVAASLKAEICWELVGREQQVDRKHQIRAGAEDGTGVGGPAPG